MLTEFATLFLATALMVPADRVPEEDGDRPVVYRILAQGTQGGTIYGATGTMRRTGDRRFTYVEKSVGPKNEYECVGLRECLSMDEGLWAIRYRWVKCRDGSGTSKAEDFQEVPPDSVAAGACQAAPRVL